MKTALLASILAVGLAMLALPLLVSAREQPNFTELAGHSVQVRLPDGRRTELLVRSIAQLGDGDFSVVVHPVQ